MNRLSVWGKNSKEREGKGPKACSQATVSREKESTEFDCRRIHVIVHQSASDKLAVVHSSSLFGRLIPVKERETGAPNEDIVQNHLT